MQLVAPQRFEESQVPTPQESDLLPGTVLLRVLAGGVCGSDLPFFRGALRSADDHPRRRPGFPMHEVAGEVVASRDPQFGPGDRVVGWASQFDAIAQFIVVQGNEVVKYDPAIRAVDAIILQPLACAIYAVEQLGAIAAGSTAVIFGQGAMGLLFDHVLKSAGVTRVTGVDRVDRRDVATLSGADCMVQSSVDEWATALESAEAPDIIVEAIGHQVGTLAHAVSAVKPQGQIFYFGIPDDEVYPFPMKTFLRKNLVLRSGVTLERPRVLAQADEYLRAHPDISSLITNVFDARDAQRAFECAMVPRVGQFKIALSME